MVVLSDHFCYEKQWQDICILKSSKFIRLWFLAYLWSFPRAYCLCVHVQLECSYPVSQSLYGRRYFYFLTGAVPLYIVYWALLSPAEPHKLQYPMLVAALLLAQTSNIRQPWNPPWKSSKPAQFTFPPSSPQQLVWTDSLQFTPTSIALKIRRLRRKQKRPHLTL